MKKAFRGNGIQINSLKFEGISFSYDENVTIFENVDFDFPMDKTVWVRAHSTGAGRSTLLQILAGLLPAHKGKYLINDKDVNDMSFEDFLVYRLGIGYTFDQGGLLHNKTLMENLTLPLIYHKLASPDEAVKQAGRLLEIMGITKYQNQRPTAVPGGVRKIASLLRPLLLHPQVLLMDDPSFGLGQELMLKYMDLVQEEKSKHNLRHVYISTFDEKMMSCLEHEQVYLQDGKLYGDSEAELNGFKRVVHL